MSATLLAFSTIACCSLPVSIIESSTPPVQSKMSYKLSVQAWSFHRFTAHEAVVKTALAGGKYIEFFPGQKLEPNKEGGMGPGMTDEQIIALKDLLKKTGVQPVAFGVTNVDKDYNKAKVLFTWAKSMGIEVINTESTESIDTIETLAKEFDMLVGFHNHPRQEKNPGYKIWDPQYVYDLVKNRDKRVGSCADTGHWVRSGLTPMQALKTLKGRVVSSHLKDLDVFKPEGHDLPYGSGVSDIPAILKEYDKMKVPGSVSVEYEHNWLDNVTEIGQCLAFVRGFYAR